MNRDRLTEQKAGNFEAFTANFDMDIYDKLRPWTDIEICHCEVLPGLVLVDKLTDNPLHCASCQEEVDPERLQLTLKEVEAIASWRNTASALYHLWLDSGEYEQYAKNKLTDPLGQVNQQARQLAIALSARIPTHFVFFHDTEDDPPSCCPMCDKALETDSESDYRICQSCHLHI